jgi:glycosyltransferase involved in cell wall biosynthesis
MTRVSVIIPTYNNASMIGPAIVSALDQTYSDIEIIVVDDGSTDDTRAVVTALGEGKSRFHYFYQTNAGPAAARNLGLREANGAYIAFLDADDIWLPTKLERQMLILEQNPEIGFVYTDNYFVDEHGAIIKDYIRQIKKVRGDILLDLFNDFFLLTSVVLLRRKCIEAIGLFREDLHVGEDYDFFLKLAKNFRAEFIDEKLCKRMVRRDSLSRLDFKLDALNDQKTLYRFLADNKNFYQQNKLLIQARLAEFHFDFAYRLLEEGHNCDAFFQLLRSLKFQNSFKIYKNLLSCFIPLYLRKQFKKTACPKSAF